MYCKHNIGQCFYLKIEIKVFKFLYTKANENQHQSLKTMKHIIIHTSIHLEILFG